MLPQQERHHKTITLLGIFFIVFFLCSWTLAASIVESRTVPETGAPQQALPETANPRVSPTEPEPEPESSADSVGQPPVSTEVPNPSLPTEPPASMTQAELLEKAFLPQPFSLEVLRGKNDSDNKRIAITFDDGPHTDLTVKYLTILREKRVPATFFFVGQLAEKNTDLVRTVVAEGHDIGTHSHTHKKLTCLKEPQIKQDLINSATTICNITQQPVAYFRPPYGATNSKVSGIAHELGQTVITWNVDPRDWDTTNPQQIIAQVLKQVRPGSIILLHEGKAQTLQALPVIIDRLREQGYEFVTISDLFGFRPHQQAVPATAGTDESANDPVSPISIPDNNNTAPATAPTTTSTPDTSDKVESAVPGNTHSSSAQPTIELSTVPSATN